MVKDNTIFKMEENILVIILMVRNKGLEFIIKAIIKFMKVNGKREWCTEREYIIKILLDNNDILNKEKNKKW